MSEQTIDKKKYYGLMTFGTVLWAGAFIAGKLGVGKLSPLLLTYFRMLFATLIIFPFVIKREENWKLEKGQFKLILLTGLVGMIGYHMFFFNALRFTTASKASIINATNPIITAILAFFILKDKISGRQVIFVILAFFGVTLTIADWDFNMFTRMDFNVGDILMLMGTICWATYSIIVKKIITHFTPLKLTAYTFLGSVIILTPFALVEILRTDFTVIGWMPFVAVLYMAIFPTVIGYTIQQMVIKALGPAVTALFINLVPIFSVIMASVFLREAFNPLNLVSGAIIIYSVIQFNRKK